MTSAYVPLEISGVTKVFPTAAGPLTALRDISMRIHKGEFVCILGHAGCGKSTVLSLIAGLERPTLGGVIIEGVESTGPGPERSVVFQAPCLLPWLTVRANMRLAIDKICRHESRADRDRRVDRYLQLLGIADIAEHLPAELSLGTHQCIALARALATQPRFLLLDEPFSLLGWSARFELQDMLLDVWDDEHCIVVMVTDDLDEALYLADRLILLTDGPAATVGEVMNVPFPRPRRRGRVLCHSEYDSCRKRVSDFLDHHARQTPTSAQSTDRTVPTAS